MFEKIYFKYNKTLYNFFLLFNKKEIDEKNLIFQSEGDYSDNARVLSEYIKAHHEYLKYKIYWIVNNPKLYKETNQEKFIQNFSWNPIIIYKKCKILSHSKYFFFTHPWWFKKNSDAQVIINLWHGIPLKAGSSDLHEFFDYLTIPSTFSKNLFQKFIGANDNQFVISGSPRNDLLFEKNDCINKLIPNNKDKIIICMTTFKQSTSMTDSNIVYPYILPIIKTKDDLIKINENLKSKNIKLLIKIHHLQKTSLIAKLNLSNIIYLEDKDLQKNGIQLYELVGQTDALITDYSSIMFDYLLIDKPIAYFLMI